MRKVLALGLQIAFISLLQAQKFENLAPTPPMGWNSWNTFQTNIDEQLIMGIADRFVSDGLKDAGYNYIVIDDGWMAKTRDAAGNLVPDPEKFPHGLKAVVDYVHAKGLKFGIYNCAGSKTCGGYPGSRGHEYQDALSYASWGVDYLKYDWCDTKNLNAEGAYMTMRDALYAAGRPMVFSLCEWGENQPWNWGAQMGQLWRTTGDITACFDCEDTPGGVWSSWGVMRIAEMRKDIRKFAGPNHWNDPDMLEVGNGMTNQEDRAHFSLWCMMAAPLMMGNDIRKASPATLDILRNKELIGVDQDPLGVQGYRFSSQDSLEVWLKPLVNDEWAVCLLNRKNEARQISFDWKTLVATDELSGKTLDADKVVYNLRDLWQGKDAGNTRQALKATIDGHDALVYRLRKAKS